MITVLDIFAKQPHPTIAGPKHMCAGTTYIDSVSKNAHKIMPSILTDSVSKNAHKIMPFILT